MHPFGGSSKCPRCEKVVYAAEQVMGPGRKLYHKPCLSCTTCKKRLDSFSLLEHDQEPYCKLCHVKNFGTRDLRQANLPNRDQVFGILPTRNGSSPTSSPLRGNDRLASPSVAPALPARHPIPVRRHMSGEFQNERNQASSYTPILRPNMNISSPNVNVMISEDGGHTSEEEADELPGLSVVGGKFQRTMPDSSTAGKPISPYSASVGRVGSKSVDWTWAGSKYSASMGRSSSASAAGGASGQVVAPLMSTATGTRYGVALTSGGNQNAGTRQWGGVTPTCPRCRKSVYFAEQIKAIGKTYHKGCLRCSECSSLLDSARLSERDGSPFCNRCYGKLYGPQGSGYALLGKAGG